MQALVNTLRFRRFDFMKAENCLWTCKSLSLYALRLYPRHGTECAILLRTNNLELETRLEVLLVYAKRFGEPEGKIQSPAPLFPGRCGRLKNGANENETAHYPT